MGSRERKRAERRKRKRRNVEREAEGPAAPEQGSGNGHSPADLAARAEARDAAARESLQPLPEGERQLVVTIGAIASALICVSIVIGWAAGVEVEGGRPHVLQVVAPAALMGVMAWGMWRARYWAVLGFQVVLVFLIIAAALGLVAAGSAFQVAGNVVLMALAGTCFYFMVKALARIQMPQRPPPDVG